MRAIHKCISNDLTDLRTPFSFFDARKFYVAQSLPETLKTAFNSLPVSHKKADLPSR